MFRLSMLHSAPTGLETALLMKGHKGWCSTTTAHYIDPPIALHPAGRRAVLCHGCHLLVDSSRVVSDRHI